MALASRRGADDARDAASSEVGPLAIAHVALLVAVPMLAVQSTRGVADSALTVALTVVPLQWTWDDAQRDTLPAYAAHLHRWMLPASRWGSSQAASPNTSATGASSAASPYSLLPAAWLLLLAGARAYYQRHGIVVEPAQRVAGRGWILALVYLACASMAVSLAAVMVQWAVGHGTDAGESWALGTTFVIPALVAVPLLTAEVVRGKLDAAVTVATMMVALTGSRWAALPAAPGSVADALAQGSSALRVLLLVLGALLAVGMLVLGARDHKRYRRLERRLAALKGGS